MNHESSPNTEVPKSLTGETWSEFSERAYQPERQTCCGGVGDCACLGQVDDETRAEANRMFEMGTRPRPRRTPRLFRRFGRVGTSTQDE